MRNCIFECSECSSKSPSCLKNDNLITLEPGSQEWERLTDLNKPFRLGSGGQGGLDAQPGNGQGFHGVCVTNAPGNVPTLQVAYGHTFLLLIVHITWIFM
jgi:hypothetical protein